MVYVWHGQKVVLSDEFMPLHDSPEMEGVGQVKITVNDRNYSCPSPVKIRTTDFDSNRYYGRLELIKLIDAKLQTERLVIVQTYPDYAITKYADLDVDALTCRALFVAPNGGVVEEKFLFSERASPRYRMLLVSRMSPIQLGFYSQALYFWPSIFYPFLYPLGSAVAGVILLFVGWFKRWNASH